MEIQYVYDESGKRTAVIIPVQLWNEIRLKMKEGEKEQVFNPSKYRGIYKNWTVNLEDEVKKLRREWVRA